MFYQCCTKRAFNRFKEVNVPIEPLNDAFKIAPIYVMIDSKMYNPFHGQGKEHGLNIKVRSVFL